jgi:hypothetical protein
MSDHETGNQTKALYSGDRASIGSLCGSIRAGKE